MLATYESLHLANRSSICNRLKKRVGKNVCNQWEGSDKVGEDQLEVQQTLPLRVILLLVCNMKR